MTLKALFSKGERARIKTEKLKAQMAAELEAQKAIARAAPELHAFISWYEEQVNGKRDSEINFVQLGYEAHDRYWHLVQKYPYIAKLSGHYIKIPASDRSYRWLDYKFCWHNWSKADMDNYYQTFVAHEKERHFYGDYSLSEVGPFGQIAYRFCAYLSYAYNESHLWQATIKSLKELIVEP